MDCPACNTERLVMSERQGIEIDYCPKCRGVWLDRGELDKIIERSETAAPALAGGAPAISSQQYQQPAPQRQHHESSQDYKHRKPKSIWQELFD